LENLLENPKETKKQIHYFFTSNCRKNAPSFDDSFFTDMFQNEDEEIFKALQHLKHNKHKVVFFMSIDKKTELNFDFDNTPRKFIDVETGEEINLFAENTQKNYIKKNARIVLQKNSSNLCAK
jgi:hypothetical protein